MLTIFCVKNFEDIFCKNSDFENMEKVERKIIKNIEKYDEFFPSDFKSFFDWLKREKVLARYKKLDFLDRVFWGISKRVRKGEILRNAVCELRKNYGEFEEKSLKEFLFVKGKIVENLSKVLNKFDNVTVYDNTKEYKMILKIINKKIIKQSDELPNWAKNIF